MKAGLALLCLALPLAQATAPGAAITLEQSGLNYAASIGRIVAQNKLVGTHLPDISGLHEEQTDTAEDGTPIITSIFHYKLTSVTITAFSLPVNGLKATVSPPNDLHLSASGVTGHIHANYEISVGSGWLKVTKHGSVDIGLSGASLSQEAGIKTVNGKPATTPGSCHANAGHISIHFNGDVIDDIINLFDSEIAGYVGGKVPPAICGAIHSLLVDDANHLLAGIPTRIDLTGGYFLDYSFTSDPVVHGTSSVSIYSRAAFGYGNRVAVFPAHPLTIPTGAGKMLCIVLDPAEVGGSAASAAMAANLMHYDLNAASLAQFKLPSTFLQCSCSGTCVGNFLPQIHSKCNGTKGLVSMNLKETLVPTIQVTDSGANIALTGDLTMYGNMPGQSPVQLFVANVTVSAHVPSTLQFSGWTIKGDITVTGATLSLTSSNIGNIDQAQLEQLWQIALVSVVNGELDSVVKNGIKLPAIPYVDILDPTLKFGNAEISVCGNIKYTGPVKYF